MYDEMVQKIKERISFYSHKEIEFTFRHLGHGYYGLEIQSNDYSIDFGIMKASASRLSHRKERELNGKIVEVIKNDAVYEERFPGYYFINRNKLSTFFINGYKAIDEDEVIEEAIKCIVDDNKPKLELV